MLQTEEPHWLQEAYENAIADADTGLVMRNINLAKKVSALLLFLYGRRARYLDTAGGYGMFTRLMRDIGFDFYWSDLYCQNLLARGFEASTAAPPFAAITAFEVLEHLVNPVEFVADSLQKAESKTFIFSTQLFYGPPPKPDWWYYGFPTGQHISFYQPRTLQAIGSKLGLNFYSNGWLHMLTDKKINTRLFQLMTTGRTAALLSRIPPRYMDSLTIPDRLKTLSEKS